MKKWPRGPDYGQGTLSSSLQFTGSNPVQLSTDQSCYQPRTVDAFSPVPVGSLRSEAKGCVEIKLSPLLHIVARWGRAAWGSLHYVAGFLPGPIKKGL